MMVFVDATSFASICRRPACTERWRSVPTCCIVSA